MSRPRFVASLLFAGCAFLPVAADKPAGPKPRPSLATPADQFRVAKGFKVELLHSVPQDVEGSWVSLCADPKGRLIVSDQYGGLFRVTPPPVGRAGETTVEKLPAPVGQAQGLLWAFDALYAVANSNQKGQSGLWRITSSKGDDVLDKAELLRPLDGGNREHGPHAVLLHPDGKRLTVVVGNQSKQTETKSSRVPPVYGEDHLLPRLPDGNGFMTGVLAPGGIIYTCTPDGKDWEVVSIGFRNQYDAAYNSAGDLFTYDADMEWDANTPWYRPTRVCHVVSGSDWGWRYGAGKYPVHYPDTLPPVVNVGPGSPTGVTFGYGAKFPERYQKAFFICDWSYGKLYATHLKEKGASYGGELEEFVSGSPLPLTDVIINPTDGAMYFTVGGRKTQSGLYRVTADATARGGDEEIRISGPYRKLIARLESFHGKADPAAVDILFERREFRFEGDGGVITMTLRPLASDDRFVRHAARTALEWQPADTWRDRALAETDPLGSLTALLALVRVSAPDPFHKKPDSPKPDPALRGKILDALARLDFARLTESQRLELARVYQVLFNRFGPPTDAERSAVLAKLDAVYPTGSRFVDGELVQVLVSLQAPSAAAETMKLLAEAPTQEEQIEYVRALRVLKAGWTPELRKAYFEWFLKAANYKGGNSFQKFLALIKKDALETLTPDELTALKPVLEAKPAAVATTVAPPRPFVKKWELAELAPRVEQGLKAGGRDFDRGRKLFGAANCFGCHRYDQEGGSAGPDLTGVAGRFGPRDLLESILNPSKEISDQYAAVEIDTLTGQKVVGRIVNLNGERIMVNVNMLDPNGITTVVRDDIDTMKPSKLSMMPTGLLDTLTEPEVLDLMAYLLSRGDRTAAVFRK